MASTSALWTFDEADASTPPTDLVGAIQPLTVMGVLPPLVDGVFGKARRFGTGAYLGTAVVGQEGALALRRSMTFESILTWTAFNNTTKTLGQYGNNTALGERTTWSYSLKDVAGAKFLSASWARIGGAIAVVPDLAVQLPAGWVYIVAAREWLSPTSATVRWFINGEYVGSVTSAQADIENGETGTIYLGSAAGSNIFSGDMDSVRISDGMRTAEEIRQIYRRMFVYGGLGYDLLRALLPPGQSYSPSPTTLVQRELMVAGDALGYAWSKAAELHEDFLPDRAWSELERWEALTGLAPVPSESVDQRRDRVIGFQRMVHGYSRSSIKTAVAELLQSDASALTIVEYTHQYTEAFDAALTARWTQDPNAGTIGVTGGELQLDSQIGDDVRHDATARNGVVVRMPMVTPKFVELTAQFDLRSMPINSFGGFVVMNRVSESFELSGFKNIAGTISFFHRRYQLGVLTDYVGVAVPINPIWMKVRVDSSEVSYHDGTGGKAFDGPWLPAIVGVPIRAGEDLSLDWIGIVLGSDTNPTISNAGLDVRDFRAYQPRWDGVWQWYIFRDPTLAPTAYDRVGAQLVINKVRPAHTRGTIIEALAALCDSPYSHTDTEPLGL